MFQKDDYVFYESGGICKIFDIQFAPLDSMPADRQYYVLQSVHDHNGVSYVPVDSDKVFLRKLLNREEAQRLMDEIEQECRIQEAGQWIQQQKQALDTELQKWNESSQKVKKALERRDAITAAIPKAEKMVREEQKRGADLQVEIA